MSIREAKAQYQFLLEKEELDTLFPGLTGKWEQDKKLFLEQYELNNEFLREGILDLDIDDDSYDQY